MLSAKLRHRVDIQNLLLIQDEYGGAAEIWDVFAANVPAEIVPLSGREFIQSASIQASIDSRITIRLIPGLVPSMRIINGNDTYDIKAILPDPSLKRHLTLMCCKMDSDKQWYIYPPGWTPEYVTQTDVIDVAVNDKMPED